MFACGSAVRSIFSCGFFALCAKKPHILAKYHAAAGNIPKNAGYRVSPGIYELHCGRFSPSAERYFMVKVHRLWRGAPQSMHKRRQVPCCRRQHSEKRRVSCKPWYLQMGCQGVPNACHYDASGMISFLQARASVWATAWRRAAFKVSDLPR